MKAIKGPFCCWLVYTVFVRLQKMSFVEDCHTKEKKLNWKTFSCDGCSKMDETIKI